MNEKQAKYPKIFVTVETILLSFPSLQVMESGFSHVHYLLSRQRNTLNIEQGDLRFKLTNLQPNIRDLSAYQTHRSY